KLISGTVFEARNGLEAVEVYEAERPDIVLLDVNMPLMDGLEALAKLRQINPDAVVIMITSLAMRRVVEDALAAGALNFIRKDTPKAQMVEIIQETISLYLDSGDDEESEEEGAAVDDSSSA